MKNAFRQLFNVSPPSLKFWKQFCGTADNLLKNVLDLQRFRGKDYLLSVFPNQRS